MKSNFHVDVFALVLWGDCVLGNYPWAHITNTSNRMAKCCMSKITGQLHKRVSLDKCWQEEWKTCVLNIQRLNMMIMQGR